MHWLWLTLICAFSLASADAATKAWLQGYSALQLTLTRFTLTGVLLLPLLLNMPPLGSLPAPLWGWLMLLVPLEILAMFLYMTAIRDHPLSLTLPYLALTPVLVAVMAFVLLGERLSARGAFGIMLVVIGAWLLNAEQARHDDWRSWLRPLSAALQTRGSRLMLGVAMIYAITATLGKGALDHASGVWFGALYFGLLGGLMLAIQGGALALDRVFERARARGGSPPLPEVSGHGARETTERRGSLWNRPGAVMLVAGLNALMVWTHFIALQQVEVAYMIAVKRSSLLFGMLYGLWLFGEHCPRQRIAAAVLMLLGVFMIAVQ